MKSQHSEASKDQQMMKLSTRISYGAIIKDEKEVEITRDMMKKACKEMEALQSYPFCCEGKECTHAVD